MRQSNKCAILQIAALDGKIPTVPHVGNVLAACRSGVNGLLVWLIRGRGLSRDGGFCFGRSLGWPDRIAVPV